MKIVALSMSIAVSMAFGCVDSGPQISIDAGTTGGRACTVPADQCQQLGLYFGTCGGGEGAVLACSDYGRCFWYTGGCPVGLQASTCDSSDICCHVTTEGHWPFAAWEPSSTRGKSNVVFDVATIGAAPVDGTTPSEIVVNVEHDLGAPEDGPELHCSAGNPLGSLCDVPVQPSPLARVNGPESALAAHFTGSSLLFGNLLELEVVDSHETPVARLFVRGYTDSTPTVASACVPPAPRFDSGTLRLSALEPGAHGRLRAEQAGGHWIELAF